MIEFKTHRPRTVGFDESDTMLVGERSIYDAMLKIQGECNEYV